MKKFLLIFITAAMIAALWVPVVAKESASVVIHHITSEGNNRITVKKGDIIDVTYSITSSGKIDIVTMQDEILYDHTLLELVQNSNKGLNGYQTSVQTNSNGQHYVYFNTMSNNTINSSGIIAGTMQFKVIGEKGITEIENTSCLAYDKVFKNAVSVVDNLTINIEGTKQEEGDELKEFDDKNKPAPVSSTTITADGNEHAVFSMPLEAVTGTQITYYVRKNGEEWVSSESIPEIKEVGTYEVKYIISGEGYKTFESEVGTFTIKSKDKKDDKGNSGGNSGGSKNEPENYIMKFSDVSESDYFYTPVKWALEKGITSGTDETHFDPLCITTRAQMVTFLWRASGKPEPNKKECDFIDVEPGSYYEKAVIWATEKGIANGMSSTKFKPYANVTRAQTVTFLARMAGIEDDSTEKKSSFEDVDSTAYYNNAVIWATENNITNGVKPGKFEPDQECLRGQVVTFLFRYFEN